MRIKGHELLHADYGTRQKGMAICECGAHSRESLPSAVERNAWHREHLADVIAGKTRLL